VSILKKQFGNKQQIVDKRMEKLSVDTISSQHNLKGLRRLHNTVVSQIRGLRSLGIPAAAYGSLMFSILMTKLSQKCRLLVNHKVPDGEWNLDRSMQLINRC